MLGDVPAWDALTPESLRSTAIMGWRLFGRSASLSDLQVAGVEKTGFLAEGAAAASRPSAGLPQNQDEAKLVEGRLQPEAAWQRLKDLPREVIDQRTCVARWARF